MTSSSCTGGLGKITASWSERKREKLQFHQERGIGVARMGGQRFDTCLVRNISSELHGVLIMLTTTTVGALGGRAGGSGSVSDEVRTDLNGDDVLDAAGFVGNIVQW